jgi:hypothetical protein
LQLRQPEVEYLDPAVRGDHYVRGFEIAMQDAALVGRADSVGEWNRDLEQSIERQPLRRDQLAQRLAVNELHCQEWRIV